MSYLVIFLAPREKISVHIFPCLLDGLKRKKKMNKYTTLFEHSQWNAGFKQSC